MKKVTVVFSCVALLAYTYVGGGCASTSNAVTPSKSNSSPAIINQNNSNSQGFVVQFNEIAQKLVQPQNNGSNPSFAFLDFTSDDKNTLVERYITDAHIQLCSMNNVNNE